LPGFFSFVAAEVPSAGLRKENGKMKIRYEFVDGEVTEVEVEEEIGSVIVESRRLEDNLARKERYHCYSLDAVDFEGSKYAGKDTPESLFEQTADKRHIKGLLEELPEVQRRRLLLYAQGKSLREIARLEGVDHKAVKKSIEAAKKYFLKNF
jgi:DNA-directed RNA polymerase specialized sigma24 family protein